jgi:hypothetical protein
MTSDSLDRDTSQNLTQSFSKNITIDKKRDSNRVNKDVNSTYLLLSILLYRIMQIQ